MEIYRDVYIYESINNNKLAKSIQKIRANKPNINLYVICVMRDSGCVMEIFHYSESFKPHNKNKNYLIIGIAPDRNTAVKLATKILQDCVLRKITLASNDIYNFFNNFQNKK